MVDEYNKGKDRLFGFFIGQVMKLSKGKANPTVVNKILKEKLKRFRRGGRVAEGDGLLNRYRWQHLSWVRIPSSPPKKEL